ncbi:MAG: negative regulator of sigma E activity [Gammaproteobacteria bacterium]|jgi:negative regulator of sigma E activity
MIDEKIDESLSALVDGEMPHASAQRLVDRLLGDDELRERWRRHHIISAALSSQHALIVADEELASRVSAALDAEPVPLPRPTRRALSWGLGFAAAAGAAALAVVVTLGVSNRQPSLSDVPPVAVLIASPPGRSAEVAVPAVSAVVAVKTVSNVATADSGRVLTRMTWNDSRPAVEARLNSYLLDHSEYLADGVRGMLPYARVVGYDQRN